METKEISTVVERITDPTKLNRLALSDKGQLLRHITGLEAGNFMNAILPLTSFNGISLKEGEKLVYLGTRDTQTLKFLESLSTSAEGVFKITPTNRIVTIPVRSYNVQNLIDATDINEIPKHYSVSYEDLPETKEVLGLYKKKMAFAGSLITDYELGLFEVYTLNNTNSYILSTSLPGITSKHNEEGKVKFCIRDLKFKALLNKKGYNLPKDRTVKQGSSVKILNKKSKSQFGTILEIVPSNLTYSDKAGKKIKQCTYHIVNEEGVLIRLRRKDFKLA